MHAFMAAILLWLPGLDQFGEDAKTDPPGGKGGKASQGVGGKGNAIVGADPDGETEFLEETGEDRFRPRNSCGMETLASEKKAGIPVGDGEGEAIFTVSGFELALEISGPEVIWGQDQAGGFTGMSDSASPTANGDHAAAFEDILNGGASGKIPSGVSAMNDFKKFLSAPGRMPSSELEEGGDNLRIGLIWRMVWFSWQIFERSRPEAQVSFDPFVGRLPRDVVLSGEFGDRIKLTKEIGDELGFLVHR